jgi:hypothetical protein
MALVCIFSQNGIIRLQKSIEKSVSSLSQWWRLLDCMFRHNNQSDINEDTLEIHYGSSLFHRTSNIERMESCSSISANLALFFGLAPLKPFAVHVKTFDRLRHIFIKLRFFSCYYEFFHTGSQCNDAFCRHLTESQLFSCPF